MAEVTVMPTRNITSPSTLIKDRNRFVLFTNSWLDLQTYVQSALRLPITQGNFVEKYGAFTSAEDTNLVIQTVAAMKKVQGLATDFGNPQLIKQNIGQNASYLTSKAPPAEIYGHIIWLAMQMQAAGGRFQSTLANMSKYLGPGMSRQQRADTLKDILIGDGGLITVSTDMKLKTEALVNKLANFDGLIADANQQLLTYTRQGSRLVEAAKAVARKQQELIDKELKPAADAAWGKYIAFTIGAAAAPVAILLIGVLVAVLAPITFGASLVVGGLALAGAPAAATALAIAAGEQNKVYMDLQKQIAAANTEIKKKSALATDLGSFNSHAGTVSTGIADFKDRLAEIMGMWEDVKGNLAYICSNYTEKELGDLPWVNQALQLEDARDKWGDIKKTAQEFTQNSLIDFKFQEFGDPLPTPPKPEEVMIMVA
jgi:hypothetical protein